MSVNDLENKVLKDYPFVFRNAVGMAHVGGREVIDKRNGRSIIVGAKRIKYGLFPGSGDFVGWTPVTITPEMVGQTIAVFTSIETKTINDNLSARQRNWFERVREAGGIALVYKETRDGVKIVREV
jgi:hypothetical protein